LIGGDWTGTRARDAGVLKQPDVPGLVGILAVFRWSLDCFLTYRDWLEKARKGQATQMIGLESDTRTTRFEFDESYLRALKGRDEAAENQLITSLGPRIRTVLRSHMRSWDRTADAYQETLLRVFTYLRSDKTLDSPSSLPGFVLAVSRNVAFEQQRAYYRHDQFPEDMAEPADAAPGPEANVVTEERRQIVRRVLSELSKRDRDLLCRYLAEEDPGKLCQEFGVDRGYLRVLLYRARLRFKKALERHPGLTRVAGRAMRAAN
jgi:RNA polymerase sigma-70 factor (ECF subfamily)